MFNEGEQGESADGNLHPVIILITPFLHSSHVTFHTNVPPSLISSFFFSL